jgi:hypothetical protein
VLVAVIVAKLLLLHRHATRAYARASDSPPEPLPSQKKDLEELCRLITDMPPGRVLPIEGRLGEGKSFLVQQLKHAWGTDKGKPVVVVVDVWRQQQESDLQAAILEALFSHPAYLARFGWLHMPASLLFARWTAALRGLRSRIELRLFETKADVELDLNIPGIRWQSHFEQATARIAKRRRVTVIVLDEVDRATPTVTQAALTLARRSVDVQGVTVVIPYIRSFIRYKAFNPLQPVLPDLGSSMDAILYEERFGLQSTGALGNPADAILASWKQLKAEAVAHEAGFLQSQHSGNDQTRQPLPDEPLTTALRLGVFASAQGPFRERIQERFEEKYLGAATLHLHPPSPADLAAMIIIFKNLSRKVTELLADPCEPDAVSKAVETGLKTWHDRNPYLIGPPLRVLEGTLYRMLQEAEVAAAGRASLTIAEIATLAVFAYDAAGLIHATPGSSS